MLLKVKDVKITGRGLLVLLLLFALLVTVTYKGVRLMARENNENWEHKTIQNAVIACDTIGISPQSTAEIKRILVEEGQTVKKNDVLFVLDAGKAQAQAKQTAAVLQVAKSELARATDGARVQELSANQTSIFEAEADLNSRIAERDSTRSALGSTASSYDKLCEQLKTYQRSSSGSYDEELAIKLVNLAYSRNTINDIQFAVQSQLIHEQFRLKAQLEQQRILLQGRLKGLNAGIEAAKAAVQSAKSRLELLSAGITSKEMTVLVNKVKAAQIVYDNAVEAVGAYTVRAPKDGVILRLTGKAGETAVPGTPVLYIGNPTELYVNADAQADGLSKLKVGQPVEINLKAADEGSNPLEGKIVSIGQAVSNFFPQTEQVAFKHKAIGGNDRVPLKIQFDQPKGKLVPGMSAEIDLK